MRPVVPALASTSSLSPTGCVSSSPGRSPCDHGFKKEVLDGRVYTGAKVEEYKDFRDAPPGLLAIVRSLGR